MASGAPAALPTAKGAVRLGQHRLERGQARELFFNTYFHISRDLSELLAPYDGHFNPRNPGNVLAVTWGDASKQRGALTQHNPKGSCCCVKWWSDALHVMSVNSSVDPAFIERSIVEQAKQLKPDLILITERRNAIAAFGSLEGAMLSFGRISNTIGSAVGILRSVKDC